jgi:HupE / UreJ protein
LPIIQRCAAALALLAILLFGATASAHEVGLSRGDYTLAGAKVTATIIFARREVMSLVAGLDADHDGALTQAEVDGSRDAMQGAIVGRIKVRGDGAACPGELLSAALAEEDGLTIRARYTCAAAPREASIELALLEDLPFGHRHVARSSTALATSDAILSQRSRSLSIVAAAAGPPPAESREPTRRSFYALGLERILTGVDQLVFLFALVLLGGRLRVVLRVLPAFAAAHSISLVIAALGLWTPNPRVIAPALALSIAYAGADNFFLKDAEARWRVAFPFGLVHGFALSSALTAAAPPRDGLPAAIALFDLGLLSGEVAALSLILLVVLYARRWATIRDRGVPLLSAATVVVGLIWFIARL